MKLLIIKHSIFFALLLTLFPVYVYAQGTCLSCKGSGTVSVRERVPVRKDITYTYLGELTKTYTNVVYDSRYVSHTCYACNGKGVRIRQSTPARKSSKQSPPPPAPPTLMENINKRFGYGSILANTTVGKDRLRVVTYRPQPNVSVNALLRVQGNQFSVVLDGYTSMYLLRDEYNQFDGLYLKDRATGKYAMANDNGRIVYQADYEFDKINAKGDIWQGTDKVRKIGGKSEREFKLINYKSGERLSPGISLNDYCACKELWTKEGLIDVELPHAVLDDRTAIGLMNREGEILIPPIYKEVLDCDVSRRMIRLLDDEGYVYDFDYLGRLLTPTQEVNIETCSDSSKIVRSKVLFLTTNSIRYTEEDVKLMDRVILQHPQNQAIDGLIFHEASCPDERGWAEVLLPNDDTPLWLHSSGKLASIDEKSLSLVSIADLSRVSFQPPSSQVPELWFEPVQEGAQVGGRLAYRDDSNELVYRTVKPIYKHVESRAAEQLMIQAPNGLWGILIRSNTLKPKYQELYQINRWEYLGLSKGGLFTISYDYSNQKFKTQAVKKLPIMRQSHYEKLLKYNRSVPHQYGDMAFRLRTYGLSPDEPISGRQIVIDQAGDQRNQCYWFTQNKQHHLILIKGYSDYYHYKLPEETTDVANAKYILESRKNGYLYIPYREGNGPYRLLEFSNEKFKLVEDPAMQFDEVYAVPIPTDEGPHTLVFENESGYFTLYRGKRGDKKSFVKTTKVGLQLLGVK